MSRSFARVVNRLVLQLLHVYQMALSPIAASLGSQCRFEPSCSQYMIDAVRARGSLIGVSLGLWRLLRCNPLSRGGYDPVPSAAERASDQDQDVSRETI